MEKNKRSIKWMYGKDKSIKCRNRCAWDKG